jgi:predicted metal-binding protein
MQSDVENDQSPKPIEILVCNTCRHHDYPKEAGPRPGALLLEALAKQELPAKIAVRSVKCLSNCSQGCSVALRGEGRWSYVYGNLTPNEHVSAIVDSANKYLSATDGLVPWRERPEHFRKNCIARIPPIEAYYE